jgi:hypothetical protein
MDAALDRFLRRPTSTTALTVVTSLLVVALASPTGLFAQGVRGGADSVRVRVAGVERVASQDAEGGAPLLEIQVAIDHAAGFHSWPDEPIVPPELKGLNPIATSIEVVSAPEGVEIERVEWPDPVTVTVRYTSEPLDLLSFTDTTVARLRVRLPADRDGDANQAAVSPDDRIELRVQLQSCDEEYCYPPRRETLLVPLTTDP